MENDFKTIENLRKVTGTLPSERPMKKTYLRHLHSAIDITIEDHSINPYKAMFSAATSTWGNNEFEQKWPLTTVEGKLEVIKAVLTHNTLPQAKEMVNFLFRVNGVPRWLFDYHTQVPFITIMSIGCRDNNKIDSDVIFTDELMTFNQIEKDKSIFDELKDLYEQTLNQDQSSWQNARVFLPQSYQHAYHFSQNLLAIVGVKGFHASKRFGDTKEEKALSFLYDKVKFAIHAKFPLIGYYLHIMKMNQKEIFNEIRNLKVSGLAKSDLQLFEQI